MNFINIFLTVNAIFLLQRWQRRWFVLYDDGELTYSVDEHVSGVCNLIFEANQILLINYLSFYPAWKSRFTATKSIYRIDMDSYPFYVTFNTICE